MSFLISTVVLTSQLPLHTVPFQHLPANQLCGSSESPVASAPPYPAKAGRGLHAMKPVIDFSAEPGRKGQFRRKMINCCDQ